MATKRNPNSENSEKVRHSSRGGKQRVEPLRRGDDRPQTQAAELQSYSEQLRMQAEQLTVADEALSRSEQRLALALSGTRIGMYDRDLLSGEVHTTEQFAHLMGLRTTTTATLSQAYHYHDWVGRVHPEDLPAVEGQLGRCVADHRPCEAEYRVIWPDDSVHWIVDRSVVQYDPDDQPVRLLGIVVDVTARKQAEEELEKANERLHAQADDLVAVNEQLLTEREELQRQAAELERLSLELRQSKDQAEQTARAMRNLAAVVEENPDPVFRVSPDGRIQYQNPAALQLSRWWNEQDKRTVPPSVRNLVSGAYTRMEVIRREVALDGHTYLVTVAPAPPPARHVDVFVRDITDRKRAEEALRQSERALRESEERLHLAMESGRVGTWEWEAGTETMEWSQGVYMLLGYEPGEVTPSHEAFRRRMHPEDLARHEQVLRESMERWEDYACEFRVVWADGSVHWVEARGQYIYTEADEGSVALRMRGTLSDIDRRKQAEEALRRSERQFKSTFENAAIGIAHVALDGRILQFNSRFCEIAGYPPDHILGKTCEEITFADDWQAEKIQMQQLLDGQVDHYSIEKRYIRMDGNPIWVNLTRSIQRDETGRAECFIVLVEDISLRKLAEAALRESEQWFRTLTNAMPQLVWTADPDGRVDYYNDRYEEFEGIEPTPDGSFRWGPVLHEDDRAATVEAWEHALRTGETYQIEHRVRRADGSYHWYLSRGIPLRDGQGRIVKWFGTATDIDDVKQAEAAVRTSEQRYRKLFEANLAGVYLTKLDGTILDFNDAIMRMLGYDSREELFQRRSTDFYADPAFRNELIRLLHRDGIVPAGEAVLRRKDGSTLHALGAGVILKDEQTGEFYIQGVALDITDRKQAEEALHELNVTLESKVAERTEELQLRTRQLQKLTLDMSETEDRERRRMAEILHDDLQQQLAAAKFHLSLLKNRAKYDPSLQTTAAQIDHMLKEAIEKSRSLSHELSPTVMHHADLAETFRWLANEIQAKHGLVVRVQSPGPVRTQSEALNGFLYKAARELLFNVVKHAGIDEAQVRVRQCCGYICLAVLDRGRGLDPQSLRETAGYGLLSIRERIKLLGGRMKIKSTEGKGSSFLIAVPNSETAERDHDGERRRNGQAEGAERKAGEGNGRLRVLLADDHEIVREGLRSLLSDQHDVEVVGEAANGREAIDLAGRLEPDVIIMDVSMPLIDGDEATRQIKTQLPETRVIALSMYDDDEKRDTMYRVGAENYVLKTAPSEELLTAIRGSARI